MGLLRLVRYGTEYSFRTKRIIFFIIFFVALTGVTLYAINEITREDRDLLLTQKVVILEQKNGWQSVSADEASSIVTEFDDGSAYVIKYLNIESLNMKIFSVDLKQPWSNTIVQPDEIRTGKYIDSSDEDIGNNTFQALVSNDDVQLDAYSGFNMTLTYSVGSIHQFTDGNNGINFKTVGLFEKEIDLPKNELWLMISESSFDSLVDTLGVPDDEIFAYQIIIVAPGYSESFASMVFGNSLPIVQQNREIADANKGTQFFLKNPPNINDIKSQATSTDVILILGLVGSPVVATMYAFIISKFRTREIAVLKAVGYSNGSVQTMLLSEIGTVSIVGYFISVFGYQLILMANAQTLNTTYFPLIWNPFVDIIPSGVAIATFIFVVLSNIFGFFIISRKSIAVRPVELFKNAG